MLFLLQDSTMRAIYDCVIASKATRCIELGTGYGSTTCVIAAALDELGGGSVTTVDMIGRQPIGVHDLAAHTGLQHRIEIVTDSAGYNWYLAGKIDPTKPEPLYDFCFLDGAHEFEPDALAVTLVKRLLVPGAWLALDDMDFKLRGCQPGWETIFAGRTELQLDTFQVGKVFDLLIKNSSTYDAIYTTDNGRTGWARKASDKRATFQPSGKLIRTKAEKWWNDVPIADRFNPGKNCVVIETPVPMPGFQIRMPQLLNEKPEFLSIDMRYRAGTDVLTIYWTESDNEDFSEDKTLSVRVDGAGEAFQTILLSLPASTASIKTVRLDFLRQKNVVELYKVQVGGTVS